jgi:hypothetical protein
VSLASKRANKRAREQAAEIRARLERDEPPLTGIEPLQGERPWLEINGWVIDAANGAARPVIIMSTAAYYSVMRIGEG